MSKVMVKYTTKYLYGWKCEILVQFSMEAVHISNNDCQWVVDDDAFSNCQYDLGVKGKSSSIYKSSL